MRSVPGSLPGSQLAKVGIPFSPASPLAVHRLCSAQWQTTRGSSRWGRGSVKSFAGRGRKRPRLHSVNLSYGMRLPRWKLTRTLLVSRASRLARLEKVAGREASGCQDIIGAGSAGPNESRRENDEKPGRRKSPRPPRNASEFRQ